MALLVAIEIDGSGQLAEYWRIRRVEADFPADGGAMLSISLEGWVSADTRAAGKDPIPNARRLFNIARATPAEAEGLTTAALYAAVKNFPEFVESEDV
jgi:hypothetical protein